MKIKYKGNPLKILIFLVVTFAFLPIAILAQESKEPDSFLEGEITDKLPSLSMLMDSALQNNPMVDFRELQIIVNRCKLKAEQTYWLRNIGVQTDVRYGTFNVFSTNTAEGQVPDLNASQSVQTNYGVGAYIKFPIQDFLNRKNQITMARAEMEQAEKMAEAQRLEVRQLVINQYNELVLKQRILKIRLNYFETSTISMEMAEKQFRNGVIPISEYTRISEIVTRSQSDYETARVEFITTYLILEEIVGFKFSTKININ